MEDAIFTVETRMEKEDYRKFLYTATFRKSVFTLPLIGAMAFFGALIVGRLRQFYAPAFLLLTWLLFCVLAIGAVCFMVEVQNNRRFKAVGADASDSQSRMILCEAKMTVTLLTTGEAMALGYDQIRLLLESKDYFIFYVGANQAFLMRKRDARDPAAVGAFLAEKCVGRYRRISGLSRGERS